VVLSRVELSYATVLMSRSNRLLLVELGGVVSCAVVLVGDGVVVGYCGAQSGCCLLFQYNRLLF
jgi:hypothetical protein